MLYGFTGSSRSGKTTLAKTVAEELSIEFYPTSTFATAQKFGFDPMARLPLHERLSLQMRLLEDHVEILQKTPRPLIIDRTPIDYLNYLTAEFYMDSGKDTTVEVLEAARRFCNLCLDATRSFYDGIFYLAPLPDYKEEPGKHAANPIYQFHTALIIQGALSELQQSINYVLMHNPDFETRREAAHNFIVKRLDYIDRERKTAAYLQ